MSISRSKSVISRVIIGVSPFRVLLTLLITYLLSLLGLQVPKSCSVWFLTPKPYASPIRVPLRVGIRVILEGFRVVSRLSGSK